MESCIDKIKDVCLEKWGCEPDQRLENFRNNFGQWIDQIPDEYHSTVLTLIQNLEYYSHKTVNTWLKKLHIQLLGKTNITDDNTIYVFIKSKDGKTNSSNDYWTEYKAINSLNKNTCIENMDVIEDDSWTYIQNIVFIDDFSGSGKSFTDELEKHPHRYRGKNVFFITVNIMHQSVERINTFSRDNDINVVTISAFTQAKAFERDIFSDTSAAAEKIECMSKDLGIPKREVMGFEDSQALVVFYNNTPNNTLGFIRYDTKDYKSLFPRVHDKIPEWMKMQNEKRARKRANYKNITNGVQK